MSSDNRPWLKHYPTGIPANINPDLYTGLDEFFEESTAKYKSRPAFSCMGKQITFDQLRKKATQFAAYMHSRVAWNLVTRLLS